VSVRVLLRILSPLLGLLVAAIGVLVALEVATAWLARGSSPLVVPWPAWRASIEALTWASSPVRAVAVGVGVVGLLVLLVGLRARRHDVLLNDPVPEVTVTTSPRSLARAVGHEVRGHADVVSASVVATDRNVTVRASGGSPSRAGPASASRSPRRGVCGESSIPGGRGPARGARPHPGMPWRRSRPFE